MNEKTTKVVKVKILGVKVTKVKHHRRVILILNGVLREMFGCTKDNDFKTGVGYVTIQKWNGIDWVTPYANA